MADWDDSDDDWDVDDDDELDARLNKLQTKDDKKEVVPKFDDDEDLAVKEKATKQQAETAELKKKGNALAAKKRAEEQRKEEEEVARKAMELEAEMESRMSAGERKAMRQRQIEEADNALTDDLFGGVDSRASAAKSAAAASDKLVLKDLKDHLKHARKVSQCMKGHKNIHMATAFLKEVIQGSKDVLDDAAISEIIKTCNVIKNEKVQAAKRKVKGQAQKPKRDKAAEAKARQLQVELYGDNDDYDKYDEYGDDYEDAFF